MPTSDFRRCIGAIILATIVSLSLACTAHAGTGWRAVALTDAYAAPDSLVYVPAGSSLATPVQCAQSTLGGRWTEASAYRWNGRALGPQHLTRKGYAWTDTHGRSVTFDRRVIRNHTHAPIIFGGWCS